MSDDLSIEALRQAARRGALDAEQGSEGIWRSSGHAAETDRNNRHERRR